METVNFQAKKQVGHTNAAQKSGAALGCSQIFDYKI